MMISASTQLSRTSRGFSLVELMVALALGLVMIGAVVTVFVSNQQGANIKQELDRAQEAFRFASHTIMRVVQQGEIQAPQSSQDLLVVEVSPAAGHRDCVGRTIGAGFIHTTNTFFIDAAGQLQCRVVSVSSVAANNTTEVVTIVTGLDATRTAFTFGTPSVGSTGYWSDNALWVLPPGNPPINWTNVRSVRVRLAMQSGGDAIGPTALFSATMRCGGLDSC